MSTEYWWNDTDRGRTQHCPSTTLCTINMTDTGLESSSPYASRLPALSHHILRLFQNPSNILTKVCAQYYVYDMLFYIIIETAF